MPDYPANTVAPGSVSPCGCDTEPGQRADASPTAAAVPVERNRFFTGKYMTARDFRDEQSYFLGRHRLHQRALHGWGIVVGLDVCPHPDAQCASRGWVVISPGIAIDPFGRELVLQEPTPVKIDALFSQEVGCGCEADYGVKNDEISGYWPNSGPGEKADFLLGLRYGERLVEPVPVLYDDGGCGQRNAPNRVLERPCARFRPLDAHDPCWGPANPPVPAMPPLPASDACECLTDAHDFTLPEEPCGPFGFIPLALLNYEYDPKNKKSVVIKKFDLTGRRYIFGPLHPYTLTHIKGVNWKHAGVTHVKELVKVYEKGYDGEDEGEEVQQVGWGSEKAHRCLRLEIDFDGALCDDEDVLPSMEPQWPCDPYDEKTPDQEGQDAAKRRRHLGIYRRILRVRYENEHGGLSPLPHPGVVRLNKCRTKLYYDIPWRCLKELRECLRTAIVHVYLNCDFVPDRKGRAVDGNHLRGALAHGGKTGDGVEGGLFESWFRLVWEREGGSHE